MTRRWLAFLICPDLKAEIAALQSGNTNVVVKNGRLLDRVQEMPALLERAAARYTGEAVVYSSRNVGNILSTHATRLLLSARRDS